MIAIVDYGAGNLQSVAKALAYLGYQVQVTRDPEVVLRAPAVVFPGVGAAGEAMAGLRASGLDEALKRAIAQDHPFFGVCLGLQLLFEESEEGGGVPGLGIFKGRVRKLPPGPKVPHMGWNQVQQRGGHPLFRGVPQAAHFYFVHSYYADPEDRSLAVGETDYGVTFCSALARGRLVATQFHPEKSGALGLELYRNFLTMALGGGEWK